MNTVDGPLVSVVIPTVSGREELLKRAVSSVHNQTYKNIELIVVNEGLSATRQRNIGISRSCGELVAFLDDDDEWLPEKLCLQMQTLQENKDAVCCISYMDDRRFEGRLSCPPCRTRHIDLLKGHNISNTSCFLVPRSILDCIRMGNDGFFDESLPAGHETDLALRLSRWGDIVCTPEVLAIQHRSNSQISGCWDKKIRGQFAFIRKWSMEMTMFQVVKRVCLMMLFFGGYVFGSRVMTPINVLKDRREHGRV